MRDERVGAVRLREFSDKSFRNSDAKRFHTEISGPCDTCTVAGMDGPRIESLLQHLGAAVASSGFALRTDLRLAAAPRSARGALRALTAARAATPVRWRRRSQRAGSPRAGSRAKATSCP